MKKLILIFCVALLLNSCSSDNNSNNPASTDVLLVKTITEDDGSIIFFNYNGNKLANRSFSNNNIIYSYTYNGDLLIQIESENPEQTFHQITTNNYSNNILTSASTFDVIGNYNYTQTFTYNSNGSVTQLVTSDIVNIDDMMWKSFYSQGNCIKEEYYSNVNNVMTLISTKTMTYDNKNSYFKSQIGWFGASNAYGPMLNNEISSITKNASGIVTKVTNTVYQYNSQDYPVNAVKTSTPYTLLPGGNSEPGSSTITTESYTYY
jgi:hypothetical protein